MNGAAREMGRCGRVSRAAESGYENRAKKGRAFQGRMRARVSTQSGKTAQSVVLGFCRPARRPGSDIRVVGAEYGWKLSVWEGPIAGKKASSDSFSRQPRAVAPFSPPQSRTWLSFLDK